MPNLILLPSHGKDYSTEEQVKDAWETGKDFIIYVNGKLGPYCSVRDIEKLKEDFDRIVLVFNKFKSKIELI